MPPPPAAAAARGGEEATPTTTSTQMVMYNNNNNAIAGGTTLTQHDASSCSTTAGSEHQSVYLLDFPAVAAENRRNPSSKRSTPCVSGDDAASSNSTLPYECRFCLMKFAKSQALGGHMNRHRQEREREQVMNARKLLLQQQQDRSSSSSSIMIPSTAGSGGHHHHQHQLQRSASSSMIMEGTTTELSGGELQLAAASYAGGGGFPYNVNRSSASYALPAAAFTQGGSGGAGGSSWNDLATCSSAVPTTFAMGVDHNHNNIHRHLLQQQLLPLHGTTTSTHSTDRERSFPSPLLMPPASSSPPPSYLSSPSSSAYMMMMMMMPPTSPPRDQVPPPTTTAAVYPAMLDVSPPRKLLQNMSAVENEVKSTVHVSPPGNDQAGSNTAAAALDLVPPSGIHMGFDPHSLVNAAGTAIAAPHHHLYSYPPPSDIPSPILPALPINPTVDFNNNNINGAPNSMDGMLLLGNNPKAVEHSSMASVVLTAADNSDYGGCHDLGATHPSLTHLAGGEPDEQSRAIRWEIGGDLPSPSSDK